MTIQAQQERRALNDGIEDAYMSVCWHASCIDTYYIIQRGTIKDTYELFYNHLAYLIRLTQGLEELRKDQEIITKIRVWLKDPSDSGKYDIKDQCYNGMELFTNFTIVLSARGLLSLPSKGR